MNPKALVFPRWLRNSLLFPLFFFNGWLFTRLVSFLQPLVTLVLIAIILALVLDYPVQFLQRRGVPRAVSLSLVLVVAIAAIFIGGFLVLPALVSQIGTFINQLPQWVASSDGLLSWLDQLPMAESLDVSFNDLQAQLVRQMTGVMRTLGTTLLGLLAGSISSGFKVFFVVVLTVFMLTKGGKAWAFMGAFAQTSVSLFVMFHDLGTGIQVFIIALVLGQILDEIILPKVMGDLIGVNPIWLIVSVFIGARLGGVMGILIAVPIASVIKEIITDMVAESRGEVTTPPAFPPAASPDPAPAPAPDNP